MRGSGLGEGCCNGETDTSGCSYYKDAFVQRRRSGKRGDGGVGVVVDLRRDGIITCNVVILYFKLGEGTKDVPGPSSIFGVPCGGGMVT